MSGTRAPRAAAILAIAVAALATFATCFPQPVFTPRLPGDRRADGCRDGMRCFGVERQRGGKLVRPGHCDLDPGRCVADADCGRAQPCVRTSERIGLCAPGAHL